MEKNWPKEANRKPREAKGYISRHSSFLLFLTAFKWEGIIIPILRHFGKLNFTYYGKLRLSYYIVHSGAEVDKGARVDEGVEVDDPQAPKST